MKYLLLLLCTLTLAAEQQLVEPPVAVQGVWDVVQYGTVPNGVQITQEHLGPGQGTFRVAATFVQLNARKFPLQAVWQGENGVIAITLDDGTVLCIGSFTHVPGQPTGVAMLNADPAGDVTVFVIANNRK